MIPARDGRRIVSTLTIASVIGLTVRADDDDSPEEVLEGRDLVRIGSIFSLAAESVVLVALKNLNPPKELMRDAADKLKYAKLIEVQFAQAVEVESQANAEIEKVNRALAGLPSNKENDAQRERYYQYLSNVKNQLADAVAQRRRTEPQRVGPYRMDQLESEYRVSNGNFYTPARDALAQVATLSERYKELNLDSRVKAAVAAFSREAKVAAKVGPSKELERAVSQVKNIQKLYPALVASKKEAPIQPTRKKKGSGRAEAAEGLRFESSRPEVALLDGPSDAKWKGSARDGDEVDLNQVLGIGGGGWVPAPSGSRWLGRSLTLPGTRSRVVF